MIGSLGEIQGILGVCQRALIPQIVRVLEVLLEEIAFKLGSEGEQVGESGEGHMGTVRRKGAW